MLVDIKHYIFEFIQVSIILWKQFRCWQWDTYIGETCLSFGSFACFIYVNVSQTQVQSDFDFTSLVPILYGCGGCSLLFLYY